MNGEREAAWQTDFVTQPARSDEEHNPNNRISVTLLKVSKPVIKTAAAVRLPR